MASNLSAKNATSPAFNHVIMEGSRGLEPPLANRAVRVPRQQLPVLRQALERVEADDRGTRQVPRSGKKIYKTSR